MIVRETPDSYVLINQHDHAQVAGTLAQHWHPEYLIGEERMAEVNLAIQEHDRGWIPLDEHSPWNSLEQKPYSFIDFPLAPKLEHYITGIDEVENMSTYAALLCSLHYATFFNLNNTALGSVFIQHETQRQQKLKGNLDLTSAQQEQELSSHLQLLKFCDDVSIYLCINEPGVTKAKEHSWYQNGFPNSNAFDFTKGKTINAKWRSKTQIEINPFPLATELEVTIPYREVFKDAITAQGWEEAFLNSSYQTYSIRITP